MKKYIILLLALCSMSACDYEAVNTNPYGVSDGELGPLNYGARFMNMQQRVIQMCIRDRLYSYPGLVR